MATLFWMDTPQPLDAAWSMARVERCTAQIWATASQVAKRGVPCVLDLGFSQVRQRARVYDWAREAGLSAQLHFVDVPADERWRRVQMRNAEKGITHRLSFAITREMFDLVETLWEPPSADEMRRGDGIRIASKAG